MMPTETPPHIQAPVFSEPPPSLNTHYEKAASTLWIGLQQDAHRIHHMSADVLQRLRGLVQQVAESDFHWQGAGPDFPVHYAVLHSEHREYFNLGADLSHVLECIRRQDGGSLRRYAMQTMDAMFLWGTAWNHAATTLALVQGRALGTGFEAALAADYLIAEDGAEFGFPEILFGLFPCGGALSLLGRRIGLAPAERLLRSGRLYGAAELMEMGVIDHLCPAGQGEAAARAFIDEHATRRKARLAVQRARARLHPLDYAELAAEAADWVEVALQLNEEQQRLLHTLARMQHSDLAAFH